MRLISKGDDCFLHFGDSITGQVYYQAPILAYSGLQVQTVPDSRRYLFVEILSDTGGSDLISAVSEDGADSFGLSVAEQDYQL